MASKRKDKDNNIIINLFGWDSLESLARELYCGIHSGLLSGNFIFAVRGNGDLQRLVITKRLDDGNFMVGEIHKGYTEYYPRVPKKFLEDIVSKDLKEGKVDKIVLENYNRILNETNFN